MRTSPVTLRYLREVEELLQAPSRETTVQEAVPQQPMETTLEHVTFSEGLQSLGKTHARTGKKCEEEREAEKSCPVLITAPITLPTVPLRVGQKR